ncbi:MAG: hypothetical protein GY813_02625 [Halieaceae bacterium]|nr:hypothetical protein [Halieaceae bacterium]
MDHSSPSPSRRPRPHHPERTCGASPPSPARLSQAHPAPAYNQCTPCPDSTRGRASRGGRRPVPDALGTVVQVTAGEYHTCALDAAGAVSCWGSNEYGQSTVPAALGTVVQVTAGDSHTCALDAAGAVSCWGYKRSIENIRDGDRVHQRQGFRSGVLVTDAGIGIM